MMVAKLIIDQNPSLLILDSACFHCQQAVEKYFKVFLLSKQIPFEKTHNLEYLKLLCIQGEIGFSKFEVGDFENYAVRHRYPPDSHQPDLEEARRLYVVTEEIKNFVTDLIV